MEKECKLINLFDLLNIHLRLYRRRVSYDDRTHGVVVLLQTTTKEYKAVY